jgi:hypothetical protein
VTRGLDERDALRAMLQSADPIGAMSALHALDAWPPWTSSPIDAAIGRWVGAWVGHERREAVRAAHLVVASLTHRLPPDSEESFVTREWIDVQLAATARWLAMPTLAHQTLAMQTYDATRQLTAWRDFDQLDAWIGEASDFAIHAVWSGELRSYITPPPSQTCAALAATAATRALVHDGLSPTDAVLAIARVVANAE